MADFVIESDERFCDCCNVLYKKRVLVEAWMPDEYDILEPGYLVCAHCFGHCEEGMCVPLELKPLV